MGVVCPRPWCDIAVQVMNLKHRFGTSGICGKKGMYIYICFSRFWNKQETLKSLMSSFLDIFIRYEYVYLIVFMYCIQINHIDKIALDMIIYTYWC